MAPSSLKKLGAAAVAYYAAAVHAATQTYQLSEEYTADNFFDKFDFFESTFTSGNSWDSSHGYVNYRSQADAQSLGLVSKTSDGQIYLGPDTTNTFNASDKGRDSIRMTSKASYNSGLMIASFAHMPVQACGAWPAFWSYGSPWLQSGEIDIYEGWNLMGYNRMAMHVNKTIAGSCLLSTSGIDGTVLTEDCDQSIDGSGCGVQDAAEGVWGSTTGATFAMEWTDDAIKVWSWTTGNIPEDITAGTPDPSATAWGDPTLMVEKSNCDIDKAFANQQLVFNIDFCGDTAGSPSIFNATCSAVGDTCASYVANNPTAFSETYFMVEGIKYYELGVAATPSASASSSSTGVLNGFPGVTGSILESTLGAAPTTSSAPVAPSSSEPVDTGLIPGAPVTSAFSHSTGYIYATQTSTDETGSETTVVVVVDTTICPVTASEAIAGSTTNVKAVTTPAVVPSSSAVPPAPIAQTSVSSNSAVAIPPPAASTPAASYSLIAPTTTYTLTGHSTLTSELMTTSTIFSTSSSTITSCASTASGCHVGDVSTVVVAVSTTVCPVTATHGASTGKASSAILSIPIPQSSHPVPTLSPTTTESASPFTGIGPAPSSSTQTSLSTTSSKPRPTTSSTTKPSTTLKTSALTLTHASSHSSALTITTSQSTHTASSTEVISLTDTAGALETASEAPSSMAIDWGTNTPVAVAAASTAAAGNATASATSASSAAEQTCSGINCVVVSSGTDGGNFGASGIALAVVAGAMFLI